MSIVTGASMSGDLFNWKIVDDTFECGTQRLGFSCSRQKAEIAAQKSLEGLIKSGRKLSDFRLVIVEIRLDLAGEALAKWFDEGLL